MTDTQKPPRLLKADELGQLVRAYREMRVWSQEQLAAIAGVSTRTVQRVETGKSCDLDTKRAIARAFEFEDIDFLNKPFAIPTTEELEQAKAEFDRQHLMLKAYALQSGRHLGELVTKHMADMFSPGFQMAAEAEAAFAELVDYLRGYRDIADCYPEVDKLKVFDELQGYIDRLGNLHVTLRFAEREVVLDLDRAAPGTNTMKASVLYLVTFPRGKEPENFATPRRFRMG